LLDNGRLPGGLATRPFDDEGNPTSATRLIDEGVFQAVLYDQYTAHKDGVASTGNDLTFLPFGGSIGSPTIRVAGVMIGGS